MIRILEAWSKWPTPAKWISGVGLLWFLAALLPALNDRRPAESFGEQFVVIGIYFGAPFGGFALAVWLGQTIISKTGKEGLGWIVGIVLFFMVSIGQGAIANFFGVGDLLDELMTSDDADF